MALETYFYVTTLTYINGNTQNMLYFFYTWWILATIKHMRWINEIQTECKLHSSHKLSGNKLFFTQFSTESSENTKVSSQVYNVLQCITLQYYVTYYSFNLLQVHFFYFFIVSCIWCFIESMYKWQLPHLLCIFMI